MSSPVALRLAVVSLVVTLGCGPAPDAGATSASSADPGSLRVEDLRRTVTIAHEKMTALAGAMPQTTLGWRPMDGVRSVSEVYLHVAADNYFVPALMGLEAPAETGVTDDVETFRAYQSRTMSHAEMVAAVDDSFTFLLGALDATADELDREMVLGQPTTVGDVWIRAVTHLHEHLGQGIAYARSNGVVPPWSR